MIKKKTLLYSIIVLIILSVLGISLAYWQIVRNQSSTHNNIAGTGCFELTADIGSTNESDAVKLLKTYPISDEDGLNLSPFTFTITNTCSYYATYQVNLETLSSTTLNKDYLKVVLDKSPATLSSYEAVEKTLSDATSSNKLTTGGLKENESITYNLRLWLDAYTPLSEGQSKTYEGKIVIIASPEIYYPTATEKISSLVSGKADNTTDVIEIASEDLTCINTLAYDNTEDNNLRYVGETPCNYACFNGECPKEKEVYMIYADGDISTGSIRFNSGTQYSSLSTCQNEGINSNAISLGSATFTCELDQTTNKYYIEAHGFFDSSSFSSKEECEKSSSRNGLKEFSTSNSLSCVKKTITIDGWRIIGVMNNVDDGTGIKEQRVKLMRNESLGDYSWDASLNTINGGQGINQWGATDEYVGADLMRELNTDYLNYNLTTNPMWYGEVYDEEELVYNIGQIVEFDRNKVLKMDAQNLIGDALWYTGTLNDTSVNDFVASSVSYQNERSNNLASTNNGKYCPSTKSGCNDTVTRTTSWVGRVALINASDYGYAVGGSVRNSCLSKKLSDYRDNECFLTNWIYYTQTTSTITPYADTSKAVYVIQIYGGKLVSIYSHYTGSINPVVYLKSNVKITKGNGSVASPYIFGE